MDPTDLDTEALSQALHARRLSCREAMQATLARIHRVNPRFNAIVNLSPDDALLAQADARDAELARGVSRGWLHGVPIATKDIATTAGFPTTMGSRLLKDFAAPADGVMVARLRGAGAIVVGRTNVPEFGLGSHTFNEVFGATRNAWDPAVSAGGSSGGAAVALAQRMLPIADGSDFMGSLRNPAAWNNVFGLRPSQGRVPMVPAADAWVAQLGTEGPMARSVRDLARLLALQSGFDARAPLSIAAPLAGYRFDEHALRDKRIAWLGDLGGHLAMQDGLLGACEEGLRRCAEAGAIVEPVALGFDLDAVWQAWLVWRRALVASRVGALMDRPGARELMKPEALWEYDQAQGLSFAEFMRASETRSAFYQHLLGLFERHDLLALPVAQVWPFPVGERWPKGVAGRAMDTYHRWMEATIYATFAGLPAMSVPAGFHANGRWPAGLQLIGGPQGDAELLQAAGHYETLIGDWLGRRPD